MSMPWPVAAMTHNPVIEILNQETDSEGNSQSYYRMLVDRKHIKYLTIDPGIYEVDDLCFPPILLERLPVFPDGCWNTGHISKGTQATHPPHLATSLEELPSIEQLWHPDCFEYISLKVEMSLKSHVYKVASPSFDRPIVAKLARFPWEVTYYAKETLVYSWIQGHGIGPDFLGYVAEEGRVVGFLVEFVEGRHAGVEDLVACDAIVQRLHSLGILHGDLNRHNFLITRDSVVLVDFETARKVEDEGELQQERAGLKERLEDESGIGGCYVVED